MCVFISFSEQMPLVESKNNSDLSEGRNEDSSLLKLFFDFLLLKSKSELKLNKEASMYELNKEASNSGQEDYLLVCI
jgi:hypothetical protein